MNSGTAQKLGTFARWRTDGCLDYGRPWKAGTPSRGVCPLAGQRDSAVEMHSASCQPCSPA